MKQTEETEVCSIPIYKSIEEMETKFQTNYNELLTELVQEETQDISTDFIHELHYISKQINKVYKGNNMYVNKLHRDQKFTNFIESLLKKDFDDQEDIERRISIFNSISNSSLVYLNIVYFVLDYVIKNKKDINRELLLKLISHYEVLADSFYNLSIYSQSKLEEEEYRLKGFSYYANTGIEIEEQINYLINKIKEFGLLEELVEYFKDDNGENNLILKKIQG